MKRLALAVAVLGPLMFLFVASQRAQNSKRFSFEVAFAQKDAPVQMQSVTHNVEFLFASAEIKNVSSQTVRAITFGMLAHESGAHWNTPILISTRQIATNVKSGDTRSIDIADATPAEVQKKISGMKSNPVAIEFGIVNIQFADGSNWDFDWQGAGGFDPRNMFGPSAAVKEIPGCGSRTRAVLSAVAAFSVLPQNICGTGAGLHLFRLGSVAVLHESSHVLH